MALDVGPVVPLIFLVGLVGLLPTAISFALIAREMLSAGSAYTWLTAPCPRPRASGSA